MGNETKRPATYEDLLALPEHVVGQIIDGELIVMPRPANLHAVIYSRLLADLNGTFEHERGRLGGWWIVGEPELHLGRDVLVPDIAGWRIERMPDVPVAPYFTLAPDWVCEVLSPSTRALDRKRKPEVHAREGVGHMWLVDPESRTLEVLQQQDGQWAPRGTWSGDACVRAAPFEELELNLGTLWLRKPQAP
ncbi:Uma2 family endonuclease [Pyxidicoccus trucidator]|uniref:Uma2 family endonuclease n=1 Tax=Pyxidicoccus trucidator TaxID=2709662 RepID=UPI0013DC80F2|nr:Uma2 family endonuclease [Pyxidicoccus trucidator]